MTVKPYERQPQVLRLLSEHGPLSARALKACLVPTPSPRAFFYILKRLRDKGLLSHRYDRVSGRVFHQIAQNPSARRVAAEITGIPAEHLEQPQFRHAELIHSEDCAIWVELLRQLFPDAIVFRDYQFAGYAGAKGLLLTRGEERDLMPDILLTVAPRGCSGRVSVAFEIERTAKSEKRLIRKLRKYAEQTRLDGLIYICGSSSLQEKIMVLYKSRITSRALRINHYADNFFLFADGSLDRSRSEPRVFNSARKSVSLGAWLRTLGETKDGRRTDSVFEDRSLAMN